MARSPAGKPRPPSAQADGASAPAAPSADQTAPAPDPEPQGECEIRYRVLSAIKYGGQWRTAGTELTLPAHIALDLKGRVEEIG